MKTVELGCREVCGEVSNYLDGEVDRQLRARLEAHFKACARCTAILDGTRSVVKLITEGIDFPMPHGFSEKLRERIKHA